MRSLKPIAVNPRQLLAQLSELEAFLNDNSVLKEREHVIPFFRARPQLVAALGLTNAAIGRPDRYATELQLFGDFSCDAASGDSVDGSFSLIEFEDARDYSVFRAREAGRSVRRWSPRFEHGFSQLVDWAWRLDTEGHSPAIQRVFGSQPVSVHLLLVIGRRGDLADHDFKRMTWRSQNVRLGSHSMSCLTFDDVLATLRRRIMVAEAEKARG